MAPVMESPSGSRPQFVDRSLDTITGLLRHLPRGRTTLFKLAHKALGNPERVLGTLDHQYFCVDTYDEEIAVLTYLWDRWEPPVSAVWTNLLTSGQTVVDVGANKGYFSLLAAARVRPGGRVLSYEPHPRNVEDLQITQASNRHDHWQIRPVALSSASGTRSFHAVGWSEKISGWGSFERTANEASDASFDVATTTLDEEARLLDLDRIDLVKMDIEGHELDALSGASELLKRGAIATILLELHLRDLGPERVTKLFSLLERFGYHPRLLRENALTPSQWHAVRERRRPLPESDVLRPTKLEEVQRMPDHLRPHIVWSRSSSAA